ncbi:diguanylate cyclase [Salinisphaera sp. T5B8]|uniref:GGDEF domain-containing protein n=1 Tax=Salinisphaera sp. T5B8 TaxID=1304154 RepID=UPI003342D97F
MAERAADNERFQPAPIEPGNALRPATDAPHRKAVLRALLWLTISCGIFFASVNITVGSFPVAVAELAMAAYAGILLLVRRSSTVHLQRWILAYLLPFCTTMMFACWYRRAQATVFVWPILIPVISYLLLGRRAGFWFTGAFLTIALVIFGFKFAETENVYSVAGIANVALCAACIFGLSHAYEVTREQAEARLRALALRDPLTDLCNRAGLAEIFPRQLAQAKRYGKPLSAVLIDIDHFKHVNDQYGHETGDAVLVSFAQCLNNGLRECDLACRLGGEEFALLLPHTDIAEATRTAERVRAAAAESRCEHNGQEIAITVTLGVAELDPACDDLSSLLARADERLYRGKSEGRNRVVSE